MIIQAWFSPNGEYLLIECILKDVVYLDRYSVSSNRCTKSTNEEKLMEIDI